MVQKMGEKENTKNTRASIEKKIVFFNEKTEAERIALAARFKNDIEAVDVDTAYSKVKGRLQRINRFSGFKNSIIRIAAVFTLPLLLFSGWSLFNHVLKPQQIETTIAWQEIESPIGIRSYLKLPDGSDLWLNSGSKIKYGVPFTRETRHLELTGEAFLHVAKNPASPFFVEAQNAVVKVLGTQFNVKAYPNDKFLEVAIKEGHVNFRYTKETGKKVFANLKANDFVVVNKDSKSILCENRDISKYIAWHKNVMVFDDTPIQEVASTLERWYGVKVIIADEEILRYKFTTTFVKEPLFRVLELLELSSPVKIKYKPGKINKESKRPDKSVVIITKK